MEESNKVGSSSATRLARINELLTNGSRPFSSAQFAEISGDRHDGPDKSLWRSGKSRTMASWIVESPVDGVPELRVVIASPEEAKTVQEFVLEKAIRAPGFDAAQDGMSEVWPPLPSVAFPAVVPGIPLV